MFRESIERAYAEQPAQGGILLLVHPRTPEDLEHAKAVPGEHADRQAQIPQDGTMT